MTAHPLSSKRILVMVHAMVNVLGTPVRANGERKRGKGMGGRERGHEGEIEEEEQREGGREKRAGDQGCPVGLHRLFTALQ